MSFAHFSRVLWRFVKPEIEEAIVYVLCIVGLTAIAFYQNISQASTNTTQTLSSSLDVIHDKFSFITSGDDTAAKIFTFGTWFIIGTVVYMIAWFLISFAGGAFKDIEVSNGYVHPRSFNKSNFWGAIAARLALQAAAAISLIIYIAIWLTAFAPGWLANFRDVFHTGITVESGTSLLISCIGIVLSLHIGAILLRVFLIRSKYFYQR